MTGTDSHGGEHRRFIIRSENVVEVLKPEDSTHYKMQGLLNLRFSDNPARRIFLSGHIHTATCRETAHPSSNPYTKTTTEKTRIWAKMLRLTTSAAQGEDLDRLRGNDQILQGKRPNPSGGTTKSFRENDRDAQGKRPNPSGKTTVTLRGNAQGKRPLRASGSGERP